MGLVRARGFAYLRAQRDAGTDLLVKTGLLRSASNDAEFFSSYKSEAKTIKLGHFKGGFRVKDVKMAKTPLTALDVLKLQITGYNSGVPKSGRPGGLVCGVGDLCFFFTWLCFFSRVGVRHL